MPDSQAVAEDVYIDTRRQLHAAAESLIAGPQFRRDGTIRLGVTAEGFAVPLAAYAVFGLDAEATASVHHSLGIGNGALMAFSRQQPVLWPEHFDVAVTVAGVNYGVSPGDSYHPLPYAYVGPRTLPTGPF
jgi:hypothetical protein